LKTLYCFSLTPIFSESLRIRQVNNRKIYAIDHGLVMSDGKLTVLQHRPAPGNDGL
jgi:predicted AAA+ superfamily ATPase